MQEKTRCGGPARPMRVGLESRAGDSLSSSPIPSPPRSRGGCLFNCPELSPAAGREGLGGAAAERDGVITGAGKGMCAVGCF